MSRPSVDQQLAAVRERLAKLRDLTYADVVAMPAFTSEELSIAGKRVSMWISHDVLGETHHLVAIQAYRPWFLGIGRMVVDGFVIAPDGHRRPLTVKEWAPFT